MITRAGVRIDPRLPALTGPAPFLPLGGQMGILKWYKRDPRAALAGMMELTLAERGAYNTILDLIYINDGKVSDDGRLLASWLGINIRDWRRIRKRLISRNKLYESGGFLRNERADLEVPKSLKMVQDASLAGLASARIRGYDINKINGIQATTVKQPLELPTTTTTKLSYLVRPLLGPAGKKD